MISFDNAVTDTGGFFELIKENEFFKLTLPQENHYFHAPFAADHTAGAKTVSLKTLNKQYDAALELFYTTKIKESREAFKELLLVADTGLVPDSDPRAVRALFFKALLYYFRVQAALKQTPDAVVIRPVVAMVALPGTAELEEFPGNVVELFKKEKAAQAGCSGTLQLSELDAAAKDSFHVYVNAIYHPELKAGGDKISLGCGAYHIIVQLTNGGSFTTRVTISAKSTTQLRINKRFLANMIAVKGTLGLLRYYKLLTADLKAIGGQSFLKVYQKSSGGVIDLYSLSTDGGAFVITQRYSAVKQGEAPMVLKQLPLGLKKKAGFASSVLPWLTLGLGVAALSAGVYFNIAHNNYINDKDQTSADSAKTLATVNYGVGGVSLASSAFLFYWYHLRD